MVSTNAVLAAREDLNERVFVARVRPEVSVPDFEPGQFVRLGLPDADGKVDARPYSLASPPRGELLEFLLERVEGGVLTPRLWRLERGDRLWVDPRPMGSFTLERIPPERELLMVATGTGIAPFVSMLRAYRGAGRWRRCVLLHGARAQSDLAYREELEAAARADPAFAYLPTLTREAEGSSWSGERGRVQRLIEPARWRARFGSELDPQRWTALLCGNPHMIEELRALLAARGFTLDTRRKPGSIRTERYW